MEEAACRLEREHVHRVYEQIAPFFNDSRYKAWPKVQQFLLDLPPGSIVADIGCGNGKYLHINEEVFKLGCDVCGPLVEAAGSRGHEVQMCDGLSLPYRDGCFDAVLSIAVIHHLSTKERRIRAIKEMARTLRQGGRIMIYVWAMEQNRRRFHKQDIFIPWKPHTIWTKPRSRGAAHSVSEGSSEQYRKPLRSTSSVTEEQGPGGPLWFFSRSLDSLFDFGMSLSRSSSRDLRALAPSAGGRGRGLIKQFSNFFSPPSAIGLEEDVFESAPHKEHSFVERPAVSLSQDTSVALPDLLPVQRGPPPQSTTNSDGEQEAPGPCLRYYHVFREGELAQLIQEHVPEIHVTHTYLDHANWCVVGQKVQHRT